MRIIMATVRPTKITSKIESNLISVHGDVNRLKIVPIVYWRAMKMKAAANGQHSFNSVFHRIINRCYV